MKTDYSNVVYLFHRPEPIVWEEIQQLYSDYYGRGCLSFYEFRCKFNSLAQEVHTIRYYRKRHRRFR